MILQSKIDNKLYYVRSVESYDLDSVVLEYVTVDGSKSNLSSIGVNGGRTAYDSIGQLLEYWEDPKERKL